MPAIAARIAPSPMPMKITGRLRMYAPTMPVIGAASLAEPVYRDRLVRSGRSVERLHLGRQERRDFLLDTAGSGRGVCPAVKPKAPPHANDYLLRRGEECAGRQRSERAADADGQHGHARAQG